MEGVGGQPQLVSERALSKLFELFADEIDCVLLNACYSAVQARGIAQHIGSVVGMSKAIGDRAAIEYAVSFYDALGGGRDFEFAHRLGCNAIELMGIDEALVPVLVQKGDGLLSSSAADTAGERLGEGCSVPQNWGTLTLEAL